MSIHKLYQQACQHYRLILSFTPGLEYAAMPEEIKELIRFEKENVIFTLPEQDSYFSCKPEGDWLGFELKSSQYIPAFDNHGLTEYLERLIKKANKHAKQTS